MRTLFFISDVIYWTQYNAEDIEVRAVSLFIPDYCKGQSLARGQQTDPCYNYSKCYICALFKPNKLTRCAVDLIWLNPVSKFV